MSNKITYIFNESGVIPGIPRDQGGEGHAGLQVDIDADTMTVLETRLSQVTPIVAVAEEDEEMRTLRLSIKTTDGREIMASTVEEALKTQPLVVDATPQEQLASNEATNIQIIQAVPPVDAQEVQ